jgi:TRAP-type C4-dicarboxylate transport system permease small subunit
MKKLYARILAAEAFLAATFLVLMVVLIFAGGIARLLQHPINWAIDAATCLFAWAVFLCADIAWRRNSLMSIEVLTARLPAALQRACRLLNLFIIAAFLLYVIGMGAWLSWISRARSFQGIPEVSYSWVTMSMPAGALLLLVTAILKIRDECSSS